MSEATQNVMKTIDALREVTKQIALLLNTADGLMKEHGWQIRSRNCISGGTGIDASFDWIPALFFRTYKNEDFPKLTAYVSVVLSKPFEWDDEDSVKEPLITACWCDWENVTKPSTELQPDWAASHIWTKARKDNGSIVACNVEKEWPKDAKYGVTWFYSLALPLDQINSEANLKDKIIEPFRLAVEKKYGK